MNAHLSGPGISPVLSPIESEIRESIIPHMSTISLFDEIGKRRITSPLQALVQEALATIPFPERTKPFFTIRRQRSRPQKQTSHERRMGWAWAEPGLSLSMALTWVELGLNSG